MKLYTVDINGVRRYFYSEQEPPRANSSYYYPWWRVQDLNGHEFHLNANAIEAYYEGEWG